MFSTQFLSSMALILLGVLYNSEIFVPNKNVKFGVRIILSVIIASLYSYLGWWVGFVVFFAVLANITALWWLFSPYLPPMPKANFTWLYKLLGIPEGTNYVWWLIAKQSGFWKQTLALLGFIGLFWLSFRDPYAAVAMIVSMYCHEGGHWIVFMLNKIKAKVYLLFFIGAVAAPINKEEDARSDLLPWWNIGWLLQAGPTVNVILMAVGLGMIHFGIVPELGRQFVYINGMLAAFNLLPIGNMDGGQLLHVIFSSLEDIYDVIVALVVIGVSVAIVWGIMLSAVASGGVAILLATFGNAGLIVFLLFFAAGVWHKQGKDNPLHWKSNQAMTEKQVAIQLAYYSFLVISTLYMMAL